MSTDAELLRRYVEDRDERAFARLVDRHLGVVYATALRRAGGRSHVAEEISLKVFADLAGKAARLRNHPALVGWLYRSTRYAAIDALRADIRRQQLSQAFTTMPESPLNREASIDWEGIRPVLDEAMDELKESDRQLMLLRFFNGLTFAEAGARLHLSPEAARKRTDRALDKLRVLLGKRGVTSTSAALGLLLANQPLVAAPATLAASVTSAALSGAPASALTTFITTLIMNKTTTVTLSAVLTAGLASLTWAALPDKASEADLAALRAENARLTAATAPGASSTAAPAAIPAMAKESVVQNTAIMRAVENEARQRNASAPTEYRDHGMATPLDGARTMGWAVAMGDVPTLAKVIFCAPQGAETNQMIFESLPVAIRERYRTLEEVMAFCFIAKALISPPPSADIWDKKLTSTELVYHSPERVELHPPGQQSLGPIMVLTSDGWKWELPSDKIPKFVEKVLGQEILAKLGKP